MIFTQWAYKLRHSRALAGFDPFWNLLRPAYKRAVLLLSGGKGVRAVVNGADEFWFVNRHFHVITWEPEEYAALDHLVRPGMTVMDIGAHDGLYTLALAKRVGPSGHVVSFEPSPDTFEVLKANCRNNGFAGRVTAENCLVGDMEGEVDFHWIPGDTSPLNSAASGVAHLEGTNARTIRRPMVTLDAYCKSRGIKPDLIKVDIEGFELNLLKGAAELLRSLPGLVFLIELHPWSLKRLGQSVEELCEYVKLFGFEATGLDGRALPPVPPESDSTFNMPCLIRRVSGVF